MYNGSYMRAYKILPVTIKVKDFNLSKEALKRLEWIDWYFAHGKNARLTIRHFGISPDTFYHWKRIFNPYNLKTLEEVKRGPKFNFRTETTPKEIIDLVKRIRKDDLEKSKYEIKAELKDEYGISLGTTKIQQIINSDRSLLNTQYRRRLRKHRNMSIARIKAHKELRDKAPGVMVQMDTKYLYILKRKFFLYVAIDTKSRMGFFEVYTTCSSTSAADFIAKCKEYFPFTIQGVQTDNGPEYLKLFHEFTTLNSITHYFTDPYCPKQNGRAERVIQTSEYEFFNHQEYLLPNLKDIREACKLWTNKYNYQRYHQALNYQKPGIYVKSYLQLQKGEVYG